MSKYDTWERRIIFNVERWEKWSNCIYCVVNALCCCLYFCNEVLLHQKAWNQFPFLHMIWSSSCRIGPPGFRNWMKSQSKAASFFSLLTSAPLFNLLPLPVFPKRQNPQPGLNMLFFVVIIKTHFTLKLCYIVFVSLWKYICITCWVYGTPLSSADVKPVEIWLSLRWSFWFIFNEL